MARLPIKKEHNMELYEQISRLSSPEECFCFFKDLCSPTELASIEQRFEVAGMLMRGQVYTEISEQTRASSATISRVNRVLSDGTGVLFSAVEGMIEAEDRAKDSTPGGTAPKEPPIL